MDTFKFKIDTFSNVYSSLNKTIKLKFYNISINIFVLLLLLDEVSKNMSLFQIFI